MLQRNMVKCNCHRLKYLVLYYKRVIALIFLNNSAIIILYIYTVCDNDISQYFFATCIQYNSAILFISRLLACKYRFIWNLSSLYQTLRRKMECNIGQDAIFLIRSEMLYFLCIKED